MRAHERIDTLHITNFHHPIAIPPDHAFNQNRGCHSYPVPTAENLQGLDIVGGPNVLAVVFREFVVVAPEPYFKQILLRPLLGYAVSHFEVSPLIEIMPKGKAKGKGAQNWQITLFFQCVRLRAPLQSWMPKASMMPPNLESWFVPSLTLPALCLFSSTHLPNYGFAFSRIYHCPPGPWPLQCCDA